MSAARKRQETALLGYPVFILSVPGGCNEFLFEMSQESVDSPLES